MSLHGDILGYRTLELTNIDLHKPFGIYCTWSILFTTKLKISNNFSSNFVTLQVENPTKNILERKEMELIKKMMSIQFKCLPEILLGGISPLRSFAQWRELHWQLRDSSFNHLWLSWIQSSDLHRFQFSIFFNHWSFMIRITFVEKRQKNFRNKFVQKN